MTNITEAPAAAVDDPCPLTDWFALQGWMPWPFQKAAWQAFAEGHSGLIRVATGSGKTYAAYGGPLAHLVKNPAKGLGILYITPLRAVARDIEQALLAPIKDLKLPLTVGSRTGDTRQSVKQRQGKTLPHVLITTPESFSLLLCRPNAQELFASCQSVIVDEWHELIGSKRGTQLTLGLARLQCWNPAVRVWGLSATLANLDQAAQHLVGVERKPVVVTEADDRPIVIRSLIPDKVDALPWAGHLGLSMVPQVLACLEAQPGSSLVFTNTRNQAERWYQTLLLARPEWEPILALHHGSLDADTREQVEQGVKTGAIRIVVCTASLDLGVDFGPVEQVLHIGSPKGIARLVQRAGRSNHRRGETSMLVCVPTHALELIEYAAVRQAIQANLMESRLPPDAPLDVLVQHVATCALGGGFTAEALYSEIRQAMAYADFPRERFDWVLRHLTTGGNCLKAYDDYHRLSVSADGVYTLDKPAIARLHRLNIGTISSDASMTIRFLKGGVLGQVEEAFINRLRKGEPFVFAGRQLELVMVKDLTAYVRLSKKTQHHQIPAWQGGRLPWSATFSQQMRQTLDGCAKDLSAPPKTATKHATAPAEIQAIQPILAAQRQLSLIPKQDELLIEVWHHGKGSQCFVYPFEGVNVHTGLAALLAYRLSLKTPVTLATAVNDYGLCLESTGSFPFETFMTQPDLWTLDNSLEDCAACLNQSSLAKQQFREIARVSGLVFSHYPGTVAKSVRSLVASSSLLFDVFEKYEPDNPLLQQAYEETRTFQFEQSRLLATLQRLSDTRRNRHRLVMLPKPGPLAFPLVVERLSTQLSSESLAERLEKLTQSFKD